MDLNVARESLSRTDAGKEFHAALLNARLLNDVLSDVCSSWTDVERSDWACVAAACATHDVCMDSDTLTLT